jgi:hypothetical protein
MAPEAQIDVDMSVGIKLRAGLSRMHAGCY